MKRLQHDVAWATSRRVVGLLSLSDEEAPDMFIKVYEAIKAGLENYELQTDRIQTRLRPQLKGSET
jgi:hypothetical protein